MIQVREDKIFAILASERPSTLQIPQQMGKTKANYWGINTQERSLNLNLFFHSELRISFKLMLVVAELQKKKAKH